MESDSSRRASRAVLLIATFLIVAGLPFLLMHEYGAGFDGLAEAVFRLLLGCPILIVVALVVSVMLMIVRTVVCRISNVRMATYLLLAKGIIAFCVMAGVGWYWAQPRRLLDGMAATQSLSTIRNVQANASTSFGEGQAWLFSFAMDAAEFERWVTEQEMEKRAFPDAQMDDDPYRQPDYRIHFYFTESYSRPAGADRYYRDPLTVIASPDRSQVYVYVDRWRSD